MIKYTQLDAALSFTVANDQDKVQPFGDLEELASTNATVAVKSLKLIATTGSLSNLEVKEMSIEATKGGQDKYLLVKSTAGVLADGLALILAPDGGREAVSPLEFDVANGLQLRIKGDCNTAAVDVMVVAELEAF